MNRLARGLATLLIGLVAAAGTLVAPGAVAPAAAAGSCDGVWVVVGGQGTGCATSHSTGKVALQSAGFSVRDKSPGFLCQINGHPSTCTVTNDAHWSYWQASRNADGSWGPWRYSNLGYTSTSPKKGDAEGWAFGAGLDGPRPPAPPAAPPSQPPAPAPTTKAPEPTAPAPAPSTRAPAPTTRAAQPQQPRATSSTTAAKAPAPAPTPGAPAGSSSPAAPAQVAENDVTPTPLPAGAPTPEGATAAPTAEPAPAASATPVGGGTGGTPVGLIATAGFVTVGGGALGWYLLRRRGF